MSGGLAVDCWWMSGGLLVDCWWMSSGLLMDCWWILNYSGCASVRLCCGYDGTKKSCFFLTPTKSVETSSVYVAVHGKLPKKEKYTKIIDTLI